jgi:type II secretory pathway pseudopilin PulG
MTRRHPARTVGRWVTDWRNGAAFAATALVLVLAFVVHDGAQARDQAFRSLERTTENALDARRAASRRIDLLSTRIGDLEARGEENGALIGELRQQVAALVEQVRQMGGKPVVAPTGSHSSSSTSTSSPTSKTAPSTTTSTTSPAQPSPPTAPRPGPTSLVCSVVRLARCGGSPP